MWATAMTVSRMPMASVTVRDLRVVLVATDALLAVRRTICPAIRKRATMMREHTRNKARKGHNKSYIIEKRRM